LGLSGRVPPRVDAATKSGLGDLLRQATQAGWTVRGACQVLEVSELRVYRWLGRWAAGELGLSHETLRNWVKQDRIDHGQGEPGELTTSQLEELRQLRRRVVELEAEREILRRAAAWFAKEMGR
jgi:transposase